MRKLCKALAVLTAGALLTLTGCSSSQTMPTKTFYVIGKSEDYFAEMIKAGVLDAGEEMHINIIYQAPESEQLGAQLRLVQDAAENHPDALIVAPLDKDALNDALAQAHDAGTAILTIDSDVSYAGRLSCIGTQNYSAGAIAARYVAELLDAAGDVAIITHSSTAQTAQERCSGFMDELSGKSTDGTDSSIPQFQIPINAPESEQMGTTGGFPGIRIVETKNGEGNIQHSCELAKQLISENPNLRLIYTTNQLGTIGACQAVSDLGAADRVKIVGFDYFDGADAYIESGVLAGVMAQNPYNMGYLSVRYANRLSTGNAMDKVVNTGATLVTKENFNDEDIRFLINPTGL